ncbi:MAG: hypothetical protein RIT81_13395 [Deltaproteobacteria bacterium]
MIATTAFLAVGACNNDPTPESATTVAAVSSVRPMPPLGVRCSAVAAEIHSELFAVRAILQMHNDHLVQPYDLAVQQLSPAARASLRRHNVHVLQFARYLW